MEVILDTGGRISKQKVRPLFVPFFLLVLCVYLTSLKLEIKVAMDLLLETFSAVIQTFVAMMALLGMVGVFKLGILNSKIDDLAESAKGLLAHFHGLSSQYLLPEEVLKKGEKIMEREHTGSEGEVRRLETVVAKLKDFYTTTEEVKARLLDFLIFTSIAIGLSIIFLAATPVISSYYLGAPALFISVTLSIISLFSVIDLIQSIL